MFPAVIRITRSYACDLSALNTPEARLRYPAKHGEGTDAWAAAGSVMGQLNMSLSQCLR